jgi:preprotein translocase subunit YajC
MMAATSQSGSALSPLILLVVLGAVFYFLLIRPQRRRQAQHQTLVEAVKVDDDVVTIGGIYGVVRFVGEQDLQLEVAPDTTIRVLKSAVARVLTAEEEEDDDFSTDDEAGPNDEDAEASGDERR